MKRTTFLKAFVCVFAAAVFITPFTKGSAQAWRTVTVQYDDRKNRGILAAEYRIVRQKKGCRLTIRLTNKGERKISHYWFKFTFKEGHEHENRITDHLPGRPEELTYQSCGIPRIHISEVE